MANDAAVDLTTSGLGQPVQTMLTDELRGVGRCPYCSVASPVLAIVWASPSFVPRGDDGERSAWSVYRCTSCGGMVSAMGHPGFGRDTYIPAAVIFPGGRKVPPELPPIAATFLRQALDTLHSPDAAAVMAGSAVDAMLKHLGYLSGSLYQRIDQAREAGHLTKNMADWAHSVRLGSNRPRHADEERPHVTAAEAQRSVTFAEALGNFLFVLSAQIEEAATAAAVQPG